MSQVAAQQGQSGRYRTSALLAPPSPELLAAIAALDAQLASGQPVTLDTLRTLELHAIARLLASRRPAQLAQGIARLQARIAPQPAAPSEPSASTKPRALPEP